MEGLIWVMENSKYTDTEYLKHNLGCRKYLITLKSQKGLSFPQG